MSLQETGVRLLAENEAGFLRSMKSATDSVNNFVGEAVKGGSRLDAFGEVATGALRRVGEVAVNALASATQAMAGFAKSSVDAAGDFEAGLNIFGSLAGDTLPELGLSLDDVSKKALQLGADTQYSAAEGLSAMQELIKGGVDLQAVMGEATDATLALAAAGGLQLAPAAEIVAKQLGVWGDTGVEAAQIADALAQAANASTLDVEGLALGLANAGGVAKIAGASFEETVTTLALLAPGFSSASDAGTSLKTFMSRLSPTTKEATKAMQALGLVTEDGKSAFYDATGSLKDMRDVAQILQEALVGLSDEEKQLALNTIFGADAIRAAALLAESGAEGFDKMAESMGKAGGAMEQATERNQGFNFAIDALKGSIETLQIVIGMALLPVLTNLIENYITPGINAFMQFSQSILGADDPISSLGQAIDTVLPGFSTFANMVGSFTVGTIIPQLQGMADSLSSTVGPAVTNFANTIMPTLTESFNNVKTGAEIAKGWIEENWPGVSSTLQEGISGFQSYVDEQWAKLEPALITTLENVKTWAGDQWQTIEPQIRGALERVISWVQENWPNLEEQVTTIIDNIVTHATVELPRMSSALDPMTQAFGSWIADIQTKFAGFSDTVGKAIAAIGQFFKPVVDQFRAIGNEFGKYFDVTNAGGKENKTVWDQLRDTLGKVGTALLSLGKAIGAIILVIGALLIPVARLLADVLGGLLPGAIMIFNGLLTGVLGIINLVADAITLIVEVIGQLILAFASGDFTKFQETFKALATAIGTDLIQILGGVVLIVIGLVRGLIGGVIALFQSLWDILLAILTPLVLGIQSLFLALYNYLVGASIIPDLINAIVQWFSSLPSQILSLITQMVASIMSYVAVNLGAWAATLYQWSTTAWQWLQAAIPQVITQLTIWGTTLLNYLTTNLPTWIATLLQWGNEAWQWVVDAIPVLVTHLTTFFTTLSDWAMNTVLPAVIEFAAQWAISAYEWVVNDAIPGVTKGLAEFLKSMLKSMADIAKDMLKAAKTVGEDIVDGLVEAIRNGASSVVSAIIDMITGAIQAAKEALGISSPSRVFADMGKDTVGGFTQGAESQNVAASIGALFSGIISLATSVLPQWVNLLMQWGEAAWQWVVTAIPQTMAHLNAWATQILTFTTGKLLEWTAQLALWTQQAWMWLQNAIPLLVAQLQAFWTTSLAWSQGAYLPMLQTEARAWGVTLYEWIPKTLIPGIQPQWTAFLTNSIVRLTQIQVQFRKKGEDLGEAIIDGMVEAIEDGRSSLIRAIVAAVQAATRAAKEALGVESPSTVFMAIGENTMRGLSIGVMDGATMVAASMTTAIGQMVEAIPAAFPTLGGGMIAPPASAGQIAQNHYNSVTNSRTLNYQPTYNTAPPQIVDMAIANAMVGA